MGLSNVIGGAVARGLLVVAVMTFTLNLLALILPIYMLQVYDRVLSSASLPTLVYLTLIALGGLAILGAEKTRRGRSVAAGICKSVSMGSQARDMSAHVTG